ncbi:type II toxin-antitoxin system VapC family toxin [Cellulomonas sp. HZM]|uniref:type II toxin-antitoxin system VapC family toxin n=1 Tax=Cellulomonas sp. HZM TaxID=1454010 RepID=UPI0004934A38|nr:type II toxin-antitoxin system VapC family toxin [Cellulomonas sp. HZM]
MRVVLDASVAVHALIPGPLQRIARARLAGSEPLAPALIDTEVLSAVARLERSGALTSAEASDAVDAWSTFPCDRVHHVDLLRHVWAERGRLRVADAFYVAVARATDAPLLTADLRLASAVGVGVSVLVIR